MDLLLAKVWYFFYFGGMVCVWPYINIFYRSHGLTDSQIGILAAIKPWVSAPASFLWSGLADRYAAHKTIMLATFVTSTLTRTSVAVFSTFAAFIVLAAVGEFLAAPVGVMADAAVVAACHNDADYGKSRLWGAVAWGSLSAFSGALVSHFGINTGFAAYLLLSIPCVICAWKMEFLLGAKRQQQQQQQQQDLQLVQLQDNGVVEKPENSWCRNEAKSFQVGRDGDLERIQQQQAHAGLQDAGVGVLADDEASDVAERQQLLLFSNSASKEAGRHTKAAAATGAVLRAQVCNSESADDVRVYLDHSTTDHHHQQQQHPCSKPQQQAAKHNHADTTTTTTINSSSNSNKHNCNHQLHRPDNFWVSLQQLLSSPAVLIFMWQATVMGFGIGVIGEFLFLFLQDLGGSETLMGLTLTVTCIAEVPAFHYQPQLLKIVSVHTMLHIVMWAYVVRLGLYALLPYLGTPWAVLPVELLHGLCFGCGWSAGTITSKRVAPAGLEATMQGIFQGLYFGLGQGLGALIGGFLKNAFNGQIMFALCAGICLCGWLVCVVAEHLTGTVHATEGTDAQKSADLPESNPSCDLHPDVVELTAVERQVEYCDDPSSKWSTSDQDSLVQFRQQLAPSPMDAGTGSGWLKARAAAAGRLLSAVTSPFLGRSSLRSAGNPGVPHGVSTSGGVRRYSVTRKLKYAELASKDSGPDLHACS